MSARTRRRLRRVWAIGLLTGALGALFALTPPGVSLEERFGLSWLFWVRGPIEAPPKVTVVSLDRRSADSLGLGDKIHNWPRGVHARLIERLVETGASEIVFDLAFDQPREAREDAALAKAIADAGCVVLFEILAYEKQPITDADGMVRGVLAREQLRPPLPAFAEAAAGLAPFPLPKVPNRVSQFWLFRPGMQGGPTLPVVALQLYALSVHPQWLGPLERVGFAGEPSTDGARLRGALALKDFMLRLRHGLQEHTDIAERLSAKLATLEPSAADRRLLTALVGMYQGSDSRYLRFYGPPGSVPSIPLHEVLSGRLPPAMRERLAGGVVFVGQSEVMNPHDDEFFTVYSQADGTDLSGVEIAATAFANLLESRTVKPAGSWLILALLGAFGLAIGAIGGRLPALVAIPLTLFLGGLFYTASEFAFARYDLWLPVVTPLLVQLPLGLFAGLLLQYREAHRMRANVTRGLRYYVPERIAAGFAEAAVDPSALKERLFAACMVTDAQRFTSLAEGMTPNDLSTFLNRYFELLFGAAKRQGGVVTDVVGDGMTCVWTAAQAAPECRQRACLAALEIRHGVTEFNRRHAPLVLPTRIGLNAGWVMVGNVGGGGRFAYSVVGDVVNTAARIESLNKQLGTFVLATDAVVDQLPDVLSRPLGRFLVVGKQQPLRLAEVLGRPDEPHDGDLLSAFAGALASFEAERWAEAAERFESLLARHPADGPSRFYLDRCRLYLSGAPLPPDPGLIRLEHK